MAVVILGAGATRGASFVREGKTASACLPPLDADFYAQLQRIENPKHQKLIDDVIKDTVELFGVNFRLSLETVFTTLEHTLRMVGTTGETRDFNEDKLWPRQERLVQAIAAVLEESMTVGRKHQVCDYHNELVDKLTARDSIISFNYDCLIDDTLKRRGAGKWNPRYGYGFSLGSRGTKLVGDRHWTPSTSPKPGRDTIRLFKLHGSLHFRVTEEERVFLKQRPYTKQAGDLQFTILPPESDKHYDDGVFRQLWNKAGQEIHGATTLVFIGYSLPPTDLHASALYRISVKAKGLKSLVLVNPDREARKRTRDVLQRGLTGQSRVLVFDHLHEFVKADRKSWDR